MKAFNQLIIASPQHFQAGRTKVPLCSTGLRPLRGRCPATFHTNSQSCKAGQRESLTTYCPWATCYFSNILKLENYPLNRAIAVMWLLFTSLHDNHMYLAIHFDPTGNNQATVNITFDDSFPLLHDVFLQTNLMIKLITFLFVFILQAIIRQQ